MVLLYLKSSEVYKMKKTEHNLDDWRDVVNFLRIVIKWKNNPPQFRIVTMRRKVKEVIPVQMPEIEWRVL